MLRIHLLRCLLAPPPTSPTMYISMQSTNNISAACVCRHYEPQCPVTFSRSGFCDRRTAANAQAGLQLGIFCPSDRGTQTWTQKESLAFLFVIVKYRGGDKRPWADFMHIYFIFSIPANFCFPSRWPAMEPSKARPSDHNADSTFLQNGLCGRSPQGSQTCWLTPRSPVLGMLRQDFLESKASLSYKVSSRPHWATT